MATGSISAAAAAGSVVFELILSVDSDQEWKKGVIRAITARRVFKHSEISRNTNASLFGFLRSRTGRYRDTAIAPTASCI